MALAHAVVACPRGSCAVQPGRVLCTHRCGAVELVVEWSVGAELRVDGGVGLQDSGAHVQNGRGAVVQTVLQNRAPVSAPKGDTCLDRAGTEPSQAVVSQQSSPGLSSRGKRRKGLVGHQPWSCAAANTCLCSIPSLPALSSSHCSCGSRGGSLRGAAGR